jgi:(p)ppGpp synthase/HD superfamily hydrolase
MDIVEEKAIAIVSRAATEAHRGQTRKDGKTPFIVHPERVAKCVAHYGGNHVGDGQRVPRRVV